MRKRIDRLLEGSLIAIMAIMVVNVLWQVFTRYVMVVPSSFTDELARYLMIWIGVLGAAYVSGKNGHVAITIIPSRVKSATRRKLSQLVNVLIIAFVLMVLVVGGSRLVYISYLLGQQSPALQIPLAVVYLILPISGILIIYYKLSDLLKR